MPSSQDNLTEFSVILDAFAQIDDTISLRQVMAFVAVGRIDRAKLTQGACSVRHLQAELGVNKSSITRSVDRLCDLGLLMRHMAPTDARLVDIRLTKAGVKLLNEIAGIEP